MIASHRARRLFPVAWEAEHLTSRVMSLYQPVTVEQTRGGLHRGQGGTEALDALPALAYAARRGGDMD